MEQKAYIGKDALKELPLILKKINAKHIFLVRGKKSYYSSGAASVMNKVISELGCRLTEFYDFTENPKVQDMQKGVELLRRSASDVVLSIGGGSVMDMAKLIRFFSAYSGDVTGKIFQKQSELLPLLVLPTTAGTGAEATHFAVVYKDKVKYSAAHAQMLADFAIVYPPFTYDNPKYLTACAGFDALAQAIEAYWNSNATQESDRYAQRALEMLWNTLPEVVNQPNEVLRDKMSEGAYWAGKAINITKTTAPHAFSYPFTSYYAYPHGHALALVFPAIFALNIENYPRKEKLLKMINFQSGDVKNYLQQYVNEIGLGIRASQQPFNVPLILQNINTERLSNNPIAITLEQAKKIIEAL